VERGYPWLAWAAGAAENGETTEVETRMAAAHQPGDENMLRPLIEALSQPSAYPQRVTAVEVRHTHISVVFLVDTLAYKVKKPVNMGFVDYSTRERRRHFCAAEVRLNQRLAPEVYLGVVPVTRDEGSIRMEGKGAVVDWAVKMKRLPDDATLRSRLGRGELGAEPLESLARRLARFHAEAESGSKVAAGASLEAVARNARDNLDDAESQVGATLSRPILDRLRDRTEATLTRLGGLIEDRAHQGVARDTHGDLRLDHVYWFPDRHPPDDWIAVDCIEFDERFRHADPIADIGFLAMELTLKGRGDLADAFVTAYLRAARDEQGRSLLPFYRSYRAAVRGKVEGKKLAEVEIPEDEKSVARTRARALWLFALSELEDAQRRPGLVLVAGLPGAGKSSIASQLADHADFNVIRSDVVRKELAGRTDLVSAPAAFGEGFYTGDWNERVYAECLRRAESLVFEGKRVLVDATFSQESRRRLFLDAGRRWGITTCLLVCRAEPDVVRNRIAGRRGDMSDADWAIHQEIAKRWEDQSAATRAFSREIDTGGTRGAAGARAIEALRDFGLADG
jgi:aminoglycoside phosphotransferase family enzyme/predicted kinase